MPGKGSTSASKNGAKTTGKTPAGHSSARQPAPPKKSAAAKSTGAKGATRRAARPIRTGLSLDRKLDIVGTGVALVGLLTTLSMLSPVKSSWIGQWVGLLGVTFGIGMYIFPIGLLVGGLWLLLRNFERVPQLAVERIFGFILLFWNLLTWLHFIIVLQGGEPALSLAERGAGGGYVGGGTLRFLEATLGLGGASIALLAWTLIALALALDVTVVELVRWVEPLYHRLKTSVEGWWAARRERQELRRAEARLQPDFTPIQLEHSAPAQATGAPPQAPTPSHGGAAGSAESLIPASPEHIPWRLPPIAEILESGAESTASDEVDSERARIIEETLSSFGAPVQVIEINRGPTITQFGVEPDFVETRNGRMRVRVGKIAALADDLALALSARTIRIQAPVPGKNFVGIEVPNEEVASVALRDVIESSAFGRLKSPLRFALGQNVSGHSVAADLAGMPHLLVAGATGSGKSVCVNALICCLLMNNTPDDLRLIMVDPKRVELTGYNGIPHLLAPVVVDLEKVVAALQWVTREMDMRYRKLAEVGARNIQDFNEKMVAKGQRKLPYLVVIVDELADLMMLAPDDTERSITRLAQLARATGIHLVLATQRPSVDVVTGLIKANFPARVAFAVASGVDSRVILDQPGAERLLGRGDMLFQAPDAPAPVRLQGVYVSDNEIQSLVSYWQSFAGTAPGGETAAGGIPDALPSGIPLKQMPMFVDMEPEEELDPLFNEAVDLARRQGRASISMLQRRMRVGYTRAARLVETMEAKGIVGPPEPGSGTREILDYGPAAPPVDD